MAGKSLFYQTSRKMRVTLVLVLLWKWGHSLPIISQTEIGEVNGFPPDDSSSSEGSLFSPNTGSTFKENLPRVPERPVQIRVARPAARPEPAAMGMKSTVKYIRRVPCERGDCSDPVIYEFVLFEPNRKHGNKR